MTPLSRADAFALTKKAKLYMNVYYDTLNDIYKGGGHIIMGYKNWPAYMKAEFDVGRSEAYRRLQEATLHESIPAGGVAPEKKHLRQLLPFHKDHQIAIWEFAVSYAKREQIELTGSVVKICGERFTEIVNTGGVSVNGESLALDAALTEELYEAQQRQKSHMRARHYIVRGWDISFGALASLFPGHAHEFEHQLEAGALVKFTAWIDAEITTEKDTS